MGLIAIGILIGLFIAMYVIPALDYFIVFKVSLKKAKNQVEFNNLFYPSQAEVGDYDYEFGTDEHNSQMLN